MIQNANALIYVKCIQFYTQGKYKSLFPLYVGFLDTIDIQSYIILSCIKYRYL